MDPYISLCKDVIGRAELTLTVESLKPCTFLHLGSNEKSLTLDLAIPV